MKKWLIAIAALFVLAACSDKGENASGNEENNQLSGENNVEESTKGNKNEEETDKVYKIGETAVVTSDLYDFDYEVTVTDFQITDEVDGVSVFDYVRGLEESDPSRFAVVYVTIKNSSDEAYVPNEMFSANFSDVGQKAGTMSELEFSPELDEELAPGEEVKSKVVYLHQLDEQDAYWFKYEIMSKKETIFEVPNPNK